MKFDIDADMPVPRTMNNKSHRMAFCDRNESVCANQNSEIEIEALTSHLEIRKPPLPIT